MKLRSTFLLAAAIAASFFASTASAVVSINTTTLAQWTFETAVPTSSGPFVAEIGLYASNSFASGFHASNSTTYSNPVGNGSAESFSSNNWSVNDYYQFTTATVGYKSISLSWDQTSSSTGPRDFKLAYSTDGSVFNDFASYIVRNNSSPAWSSSTVSSAFSYNYDLSSLNGLDGLGSVYFRLIDTSSTSANGGLVATSGTDRVDNFTVRAVAIPEPSAYAALLGAAALGFAVRRRRLA